MRSWLIRRRRFLTGAASLGIALLSGVYVNLLTAAVLQTGTGNLLSCAWSLGWWNVLLAADIALVFTIYYLGGVQQGLFRAGRDRIIQEILAAACRSIIYPHSRHHIRAIITMYDPKTQTRWTRYSYNTEPDPERTLVVPFDFGITGKAFKNRCVVIEGLPPTHTEQYPPEIRDGILPELRTVIAAPLMRSLDRKSPPMGVIAFDSILEVDKLVKDEEEMRHIAQKWADIIANILTATGGD
ncbi:MAG TPA: hypothetical protein VMH22_01030 [bacterium]|nr:hypothetical protein [bacterium]